MPIPLFADLHTSNQCQMNCDGCAYKGTIDGSMMSEKDHFEVVDQLMDFGVKAFDFAGGGEPLCLPYIKKLMLHIHKRGCFFGLITNGLGLDDDMADVLVHCASYVRVSLEASTVLDYSRYKHVGTDVFYTVYENTQRLLERKHAIGSMCDVSVKFSVGRTLWGHEHYQEAIDLGRRMGADSIQFKALRHEPEELPHSDKIIQSATLHNVLERCGDHNVRYWILPWKEEDVPNCWLSPLHTVVDYKGNVYLCCYYYYREGSHFIGNMLEKKFYEIWGSDRHRQQLQTINKSECRKVDCKFFRHHKDYEEAMKMGKVWFL